MSRMHKDGLEVPEGLIVESIERYDMASGKVERVTGGPGGAARPEPSPDGRYMAFVRRERAKTT